MRFSSNLKRILLIGTIVLLGCDVSLLFAAEDDNRNVPAQESNPQLQKLQAQINALQSPSSAKSSEASPATPSPDQQTPPSLSNGTATSVANSTAPKAALPSLDAGPLAKLPQDYPQQQIPNIPPPAYQPTKEGQNGNVSAANNQGAAGGNPDMNSDNSKANSGSLTQKDVSEVAFNNMVQNSMPMSPDQIQKLRSTYMASQFAAASVPGTPPRPTATSVFADLSPGATPPVVRLGQGFVTSLVFVDSTGAPWPIESYDVGNPTAFNIQWDKISNTLMIQSTVLYTYGNLAIKLKGLNTPVMITLVPGQKAIDYRVDLRVPGYGPSARPFTSNTLPEGSNQDLLNILDGVPPPNSTTLKVEGGNCQAWLSHQKMYVRTRLSVLSPGWTATLSSADGMHAYEMQSTPMLLVSQNGQVVQLKVQGF